MASKSEPFDSQKKSPGGTQDSPANLQADGPVSSSKNLNQKRASSQSASASGLAEGSAISVFSQELSELKQRLHLQAQLKEILFKPDGQSSVFQQAVTIVSETVSEFYIYFAEANENDILRLTCGSHQFGTKVPTAQVDLNLAKSYGKALKANRLIMTDSFEDFPGLGAYRTAFKEAGIEAAMEMPVFVKDRVKGVLGFGAPIFLGWSEFHSATIRDVVQFLTLAFHCESLKSEKQRHDQALDRARHQKTPEEFAKSNFLATMSHEIRTPLNGIVGMTRLLLETSLDEEQEEYAQVVQTSAEQLLNIINNILDVSKIEAGKLELEHVTFNLRQVLDRVGELLAVRAQEKELELILYYPVDLPQHVIGDPGRLTQILINLVNNAIKFTDRGEVIAKVKLISRHGKKMRLEFQVVDTGIGIPESRLDSLFESFTQVDASTTRKYGGTGLGLTISKWLTEAMGGKIGVKSELGKGSTFFFTSVLEIDDEDPESHNIYDSELGGLRTLIIDPNLHSRTALEELSKALGCHVRSAGLAVEAIQRFGSHLVNQSGVALIDYQCFPLPKTLHDFFAKNKAKKIVMVPITQRAQMPILDVDAIITKPVKLASLRMALRKLSNLEWLGESAGNAAIPVGTNTQGHILVVDDQNINLKLCSLLLKKAGCTCDFANNGREALVAMATGKFDLILMDCLMPVMDGFEATRIIRDGETKDEHIPIIALTAGAMDDDRRACFEAGMDDFLSKPISVEKLYEILEEYLPGGNQTVEHATEPMTQASLTLEGEDDEVDVEGYVTKSFKLKSLEEKMRGYVGVSLDTSISLTTTDMELIMLDGHRAANLKEEMANNKNPTKRAPSKKEHETNLKELNTGEDIDFGKLNELAAGNRAVYEEIVSLFIAEAERNINGLKQAINADKPEEARKWAHTLRGGCASVGAIKMEKASAAIETLAKDKHLAKTGHALVTLERAFAALLSRLAGHEPQF